MQRAQRSPFTADIGDYPEIRKNGGGTSEACDGERRKADWYVGYSFPARLRPEEYKSFFVVEEVEK